MSKENIKETNHYPLGIDSICKTVSLWTKEAGTMLPKTEGQVKTLIEEGVTAQSWIYGREPILAGFGAVTFHWPDDWKELGCIIVDKKFRNQGVGHSIVAKLIKSAQNTYPEAKLFALCNEKSLKIFLDNGAQVITDPGVLPAEVFAECVNCPKFQEVKGKNDLCCDIPVLIPGISTEKSKMDGCYR